MFRVENLGGVRHSALRRGPVQPDVVNFRGVKVPAEDWRQDKLLSVIFPHKTGLPL